jgi:probable rRNA maturation factor
MNIDTSEEGDPQSPVPLDGVASLERVFAEELAALYPDAACYARAEVSVSFLNEGEMREINKKHRGVDEVTDVLSFPLWEVGGRFAPESLVPMTDFLPLGDILICPEGVRRFHESLPYLEALCLLLAHGFLHLLAWDHDTPEKERAMWERQELLKSRLLAALPSSALPSPALLFQAFEEGR